MPVDINGTTGVTTPGLASTAMPMVSGTAIEASGTNSDGDWVKFSDGFMYVKTVEFTPTYNITSFQDKTSPQTFVGVHGTILQKVTHPGGGPGNTALDVIAGHAVDTADGTKLRFAFRGPLSATADGTICLVGVGRWK